MKRARRSLRTLAAAFGIGCASACAPEASPRASNAPVLEVYAAASLREALQEIVADFERERGVRARLHFAASNVLADQILAAGKAHVFLSADEHQMDRLASEGALQPGARWALLSNELVVVEPGDARRVAAAEDLRALERIALGRPEIVPAGRYARAWLQELELWEALRDRVVPAVNVRAALGLVTAGAVPAAIVYASDAAAHSGRVRVALRAVARDSGGASRVAASIVYPLAICAGAPPAATALAAYLRSSRAAAGFAAHGFTPLAAAPAELALEAQSGPRAARPELVAFAVSLRVAALALLCASVPGIALGYALARRRFRGKSLVETVVALPLVLPPTAVGYALLRVFSRTGPLGPERLGFDLDVLLTWRGAVVCAAVMSLPLIVRTARVSFESVSPRLEQMGRSLGMSDARVFWSVTLPLARRGLAAAMLLGFARALGEFGATMVVAGSIPGESQTLALAIFDDIQLGDDAGALRLLLLSTALAFAAVFVGEQWSRRTPGGRA